MVFTTEGFLEVAIESWIAIRLDNRIYSYTVIVNLMLICIQLSEMWSFTVNMPENPRYFK